MSIAQRRYFRLFVFGTSVVVLCAGVFFIMWQFRAEGAEAAEAIIVAQMTRCYEHDNTPACYEINAREFLGRFPLALVIDVLGRHETSPAFFSRCHLTAHYLGQEAYKKYRDIPAIFAQGSGACLGGVYHGAVEGYFMSEGLGAVTDDDLAKRISGICGKPEDFKEPQTFTECNHGMGHALMFFTHNDLPRALDLCDALATGNERSLCYTGALMANGDAAGSAEHPTTYIRADDPLYPCPLLKTHQQEQCYTYGVLSRFQYDIPKSVALCMEVPLAFRSACFETFGRDRTMLTAEPEELRAQCAHIADTSYRALCHRGAAYNLVIRFGLGADAPFQFCALSGEEEKETCYQTILRAARNLTTEKNELNAFCAHIQESHYRDVCLHSG